MLLLLMKYGLNMKFQTEKNETLLFLFVASITCEDFEAVEIAKLLIDSGVSINKAVKDFDGYSPLTYSLRLRNSSLTKFLIKYGADVNQKDNLGLSCLHKAMYILSDASPDIFDLMISKGADVNTQSYCGSTPLHTVCGSNDDEKITFLISRGAEMSLEDILGTTPFSGLKSFARNYDKSCIAMIKQFSKLTVAGITISKTDLDLINENPETRGHFEKCTIQLKLMASTKFHNSYSYFSVLSKRNLKKIAHLTKNVEVISKFEKDLCKFTYYVEDLKEILKEAFQIENSFDAV